MRAEAPSCRTVLALTGLGLFACVACEAPRPVVLAHRAQGVGVIGENLVENVPILFAEGFGAEIDVRGDGVLDFELGHNGPEGTTLEEVIVALEAEWDDAWAGRVLVIDIADDEGDRVSDRLIEYLDKRLEASPLASLVFIVQGSHEAALARMEGHRDLLQSSLDLRFALTFWTVVEYSVPDFIDYVVANVVELPPWPHPKPLILFGVATRGSYEQVVTSESEVFGVLTDHPRRVAGWQP